MKKITILGLHLNFGGVEQAIVNQANALCNEYEIELIMVYKINEPAFEIDPKVKIKYLTNVVPNKADFLKYLKEKKLIHVLKEGIRSIFILFKKYHSLKKYIKNCNSNIIISSRIEITEQLNKYSKKILLQLLKNIVITIITKNTLKD